MFKKKVKLYEVVYREIDTEEVITQIMDSATYTYFATDWAYEIISVKNLK